MMNAFSLLCGMGQNTQKIFDAYKKELGNISIEPPKSFESIYPQRAVISDDGEWLAIPGQDLESNNVTCWSLSSDKFSCKKTFSFNENTIPHIYFGNNSIELYRIQDSQYKWRERTLMNSQSAKYLHVSHAVGNAEWTGLCVTEHLWDPEGELSGHEIYYKSANNRDGIYFIDNKSGKELAHIKYPGVEYFVTNRQGTRCAFNYNVRGKVCLWDTNEKDKVDVEKMPCIVFDNDSHRCGSLSFNKQGMLLALLMERFPQHIDVWDVGNLQKLTKHYTIPYEGSFSFMSDGLRIMQVSHSKNNPLQHKESGKKKPQEVNLVTLWNTKGEKTLSRTILTEVSEWSNESAIATCVVVSPEHDRVIIILEGGTILLWKPKIKN
jgi:hypothetical protein